MTDFMAGAVTLAYVIATLHFLHFWQRTSDRLFLSFALAFALLALNQFLVFTLGADDERGNYAYILRVLGFALILFAIVDKNLFGRSTR
jgi:hypothetical protein